jgi:cytochrome c
MLPWNICRRYLLPALAIAAPAFAQFTYPGCAAVTSADFRTVPLVNNQMNNTVREPMKMALSQNAQGDVDVYFVQRYGMVRKYDGTTKALSTLTDFNYGSDSIASDRSEGLLGIALDPGFRNNGWIYLYFAIKNNWRVARFTLQGSALNRSTEKAILRFSASSYSQHMGGALRFDWDGNLWITVGDNGGGTTPGSASAANPFQAANTNSYFGKILRIKPRAFPDNQTPAPGVGSTYDVPSGNLFPQGTAKTLPEIYVMGSRNPYTLDFDPVRKAVTWGDVGPDNYPGASDSSQWTEEHNFTTQPGNFGWPYWAGNQTSLQSGGGTPQNPVNNRTDNTGLNNLPPARPPIHRYVKNCAVTGPVYYYDAASSSTVKFPPHFHGAWIFGDFNNEWIDAVTLNPSATGFLGRMRVVNVSSSGSQLNALLELQMGPDGALYVLNYAGYRTFTSATGILRVEYRGNCRPVTPLAETEGLKRTVFFDGSILKVRAAGPHTLEVRDATGRLTWRRSGNAPAEYDLRELRSPGLHFLAATTREGVIRRKFVR